MEKEKKCCFVNNVLCIFNSLVLIFVAHMANTTCVWTFHQPEFPEEAKKFSRIQ